MTSNPSTISALEDEIISETSLDSSDIENCKSMSPSSSSQDLVSSKDSTKKKKPKPRKSSPEYRQRSGIPSPNRKRYEEKSLSSSSFSETMGTEEDSEGAKRIRKRSSKSKTEVPPDLVLDKSKGKLGKTKKGKQRHSSPLDRSDVSTEESGTETSKNSNEEETLEQIQEETTKINRHKTLEKLIDVLVGPLENIEKNYINSFILSHEYFMESTELLNTLITRFESLSNHKDHLYAKMRIINVLKKLIEFRYYSLRNNEVFATKLNEFVTSLRECEDKNDLSFHDYLSKSMASNEVFSRNSDEDDDPPPPLQTINVVATTNVTKLILEYNPTEFARQNTLRDYALFHNINLEELYHTRFNDKKLAPGVTAFIERFNFVTSWVASSILSIPKFKTRVAVLTKHIQIMDELRKLKNFHGMMAFYSALNINAVSRLKKTWKEVGSKHRDTFNNAQKFFDNSQDFKTYRSYLKSVDPPCIPYFGFILSDLVFTEEFPTFIEEDGQKYVNWKKMCNIANFFIDVLRFQRTKYNLVEAPSFDLKSWNIDETGMIRLSLNLEPDEPQSQSTDSPKKSKSHNKPIKKPKTFGDLIDDQDLYETFLTHLNKTYNGESLMFWREACNFKHSDFNDTNNILNQAMAISEKFIFGSVDDGHFVVSLPSNVVKEISNKVEAKNVTINLFDNALLEVEHSILKPNFQAMTGHVSN